MNVKSTIKHCVLTSLSVNEMQTLPERGRVFLLRVQCPFHASIVKFEFCARTFSHGVFIVNGFIVCSRKRKWSGEGSRSSWKCVFWKTNRAVIIFIPVCSYFSKRLWPQKPGPGGCQETRAGGNSFSTLGMKIERRPRNVEWRLNGRRCSVSMNSCAHCKSFSSALLLFCHSVKKEKACLE